MLGRSIKYYQIGHSKIYHLKRQTLSPLSLSVSFFFEEITSHMFDLAILFDGSTFITREGFGRTQLFAKTVLSSFNISQDQSNVACVVYARDVRVSFNFTDNYSLSAVSTAIDDIAYLNQPLLNITAALKVVSNTLFANGRQNVTRIVLVFVSDILSGNLTEITQDLHQQGIIIITIGVGFKFLKSQLEILANKPSLVLTTTLQHIDTVKGITGGQIAQGKRPSSRANKSILPKTDKGGISLTLSPFNSVGFLLSY